MFEFNIKGCRLNIRFSLFVLIAFCNLIAGIENGFIVLCAVILHECAHLCAMLITGNLPDSIHLSGLGMRIQLPKGKQPSYMQNVVISLAGPVVSLICGGTALLLGQGQTAMVNLALGLFHILPIEPLDGGLALHALLSMLVDEKRAEKITTIVSLLLLMPIMLLGFMILLETKNNFSLLAVSVYLMMYLILSKKKFI